MKYRVVVERQAARELSGLPTDVRDRMRSRLRDLANDPRPPGSKRLAGSLRHLRRLRVGVYRAVYAIDDNAAEVVVLAAGHRSRVCDLAFRRS